MIFGLSGGLDRGEVKGGGVVKIEVGGTQL